MPARNLARIIRAVVGGRLTQAGLGEVWSDDRTWLEIASEISTAFSSKFVVLEKNDHAKLVADAEQMRDVRRKIAAYRALNVFDNGGHGSGVNAYEKWAKENLT